MKHVQCLPGILEAAASSATNPPFFSFTRRPAMDRTFAVAIGGAAGQGVATPGDIFAKLFARRGHASIPYLTPPRQVVDREWTGSFKGECRESSYVQEI